MSASRTDVSSAKKPKLELDNEKPQDINIISNLSSLLLELNGGNPLDLTVTAAINALELEYKDNDNNATSTTPSAILDETMQKLFANHVGTSPEAVIQNAHNFIEAYFSRQLNLFNETQDRGGNSITSSREIEGKVFDCPLNNGFIKGPRPDPAVWLSLFLGEDHVHKLLENTISFEGLHHNADDGVQPREAVMWTAVQKELPRLQSYELLVNILSYVRKMATEYDNALDRLLRFAVLYGLDGVMKDVLRGAYGDISNGNNLTINSLLPLASKPPAECPHYADEINDEWFMPALHIGAILGHCNIVSTAFKELNANVGAGMGIQSGRLLEPGGHSNNERSIRLIEHMTPGVVLEWLILSNNKRGLKYIVEDCGFQFRWMSRDRSSSGRISRAVHRRIFDLAEYESNPLWKGKVRFEDYMWESSNERSRIRAKSTYKEQMAMLDYLTELGFPFELLFPYEPNIEALEQLHKNEKMGTREAEKQYMKSLCKDEKKAMQLIGEMTAAYNYLQYNSRDDYEQEGDEENGDGENTSSQSHSKMLNVCQYYRMLKSKWDGKKSQVARLPDFEALDWAWREEQRRQEHPSDDEDDYSEDDMGDY